MLTGTCLCGAVRWIYRGGDPGSATACNCTACRRYGVLWIYGHEGEDIAVEGRTVAYTRPQGAELSFNHCPACGCVTHWRGLAPQADGRRRIAVNIRLCAPEAVAHLPIRHFDGLTSFEDLPDDGRKVRDLWF